jgi:hypothetical protein
LSQLYPVGVIFYQTRLRENLLFDLCHSFLAVGARPPDGPKAKEKIQKGRGCSVGG